MQQELYAHACQTPDPGAVCSIWGLPSDEEQVLPAAAPQPEMVSHRGMHVWS